MINYLMIQESGLTIQTPLSLPFSIRRFVSDSETAFYRVIMPIILVSVYRKFNVNYYLNMAKNYISKIFRRERNSRSSDWVWFIIYLFDWEGLKIALWILFRMNEDLTDAQIRSICEKNGIKVGPLTSSTRKIYLKKIEKIQSTVDTKSDSIETILEKGLRSVFYPRWPYYHSESTHEKRTC